MRSLKNQNKEEMEENGDIEGLIHALKDDTESVRKRSNELLLKGLEIHVQPELLIQFTYKIHISQYKKKVITALGRIQDKKAVPSTYPNSE